MNHSSAHDLLPGYVLDALSPAEQAAFEAHLGGCPLCRAEVAHLSLVGESLGGAHAVLPPPQLEDAVMAGIQPVASARRHTTGRRWLVGAAAAVILFAAGTGVGALVQNPSQPPDVIAAMSVASAPDAVAMPLTIDGAQANLVVSHDMDSAAVLGGDVPMPADGGVYQMWQKGVDGSMNPVGSFTPNRTGHVAQPLTGSVHETEMYVLTVEPEPGMTHPTSQPIAEVPM